MPALGIVVALPAEARSIVRRRLDFGSLHALPEGHWLAISGAGPARAEAAAQALVERGVQGLISWGCAAATVDELQPGHLLLAARVQGACGAQFESHPDWRAQLRARLPQQLACHAGSIRESVDVVSSRSDKQAVNRETGAYAIDMESAAVARTADRHQHPFLAVRAIADPAHMDFPAAVTRALNPRGDVRMGRLLGHLALHPQEIPGLIALGRAFGAAMNTLHQVRRAAGADFGFPAP